MTEPLTEWETFILRHQKPGNLAVHFVSWLMFFGGPLIALLTFNPWWLSLFLLSGATGAAGHFIFGDSGVSLREATSNLSVPVFVSRMFWDLLRGKYWSQVQEAQRKAQGLGLIPDSASCT